MSSDSLVDNHFGNLQGTLREIVKDEVQAMSSVEAGRTHQNSRLSWPNQRPLSLAISLNRENGNLKAHENPCQTRQSSPDYPSDPIDKFDANVLHRRRGLNQTA